MSATAFIVTPETLIFRNSDEKDSDSLEISVRNISKKPIRIRFSLPQTNLFYLSSGQTFLIPPGLVSSVKISHQSKSNVIEKSSVRIYSPDESVQIPIIAYPPSPNVQFNEKDINLGTMSYMSIEVRKFSFTNFGTLEGNFKIKSDNKFIEITPKNGTIKPNGKVEASFTFNPPAPGNYSFHITLSVEKNVEIIKPLLVTAEVLDQSISLQFEKKDLDCLDFGPLFYGTKRNLVIQIVNRSSSKRSFTIRKPFSEKLNNSVGTSAASLSPKSFFRTSSVTYDQRQSSEKESQNSEKQEDHFSISPLSGELKPKSSTNITVTFSPPPKSVIDDIETIYSSLSEVCITDTDRVLPFKMTGSGVRVGYSISCVDFDFQRKKVKSRSIKMFSIQNESKVLPIQFKIKQIAHFHFFPSSGSIAPNCLKDIQVIFSPNSLGLFNTTTTIEFCQSMQTRTIKLSGESVSEISPEEEMTGQEKPFKYPNITEFPSSNVNVKAEYKLSREEVIEKYEKRKIFDSYLTDMEKKREEHEKERELKVRSKEEAIDILKKKNQPYSKDDLHDMIVNQIKKNMDQIEDPVSLGFKPHEGLNPPNPTLRVREPMKLPSEMFRVRNTKKKSVFNDKVTIEKKFKPKPTKRIEINECSKVLQPTQLLHVIPSSQLVNFGTVSVFSNEVRSFQITNNNQMHILTEIIPFQEIVNSKPKSQVIPPNQTAGFDIVLDTSKPGSFTNKFQYVINGKHTYSITVIATINPIDVTMNSSVINFRLPNDSFQNYSCQNLTLFNNSNSIAKYEITGFEDSVFSFHEKSGSIQPNSNTSIEITYKPDTSPHSERIIDISVFGGSSLLLRLVGDTGRPLFSLNRKNVDYGLISLGVKTVEYIEIINDGDDAGVFSITPSFTDILTITPPKGRVNKHSSLKLLIEVTSEKPGRFDIPIKVTICGSNPIFFNVSGHAEIPQVEVSCDSIDFGKMFLGTVTSKSLSITNVGVIPATLNLDMSDLQMFNIKYTTDAITEIQQVKITPSKSKINETDLTIMNDDTITFSGYKYKIELKPQKVADFELVYRASESGKVSFFLPLILENVSNEDQVKQPFITAEAVKTPLFLSTLELNFGSVPLHDPLNPNNRPKTETLVLRNESPSRINFRLDLETPIFQLHAYNDTLEYACSSTIFVHFKPTSPIPYTYSMPLYVITESGETLIAQIQLNGIGSSRLFSTSTNYLALPIVPLGVRTCSEIDFLNIGCIPTEIDAKIAINEKQFPIEISFPKGKKMNFNTLSIPIKVSFVSMKPISFSTVILIVDKNGNNTAFTVSITTDNSIFTLYSFLSSNTCIFDSSEDKPITLQITNERRSIDVLSNFLSISDFVKVEPTPSLITDDSIQFFVRFLNECILSNPIRNFPMDFIENGNQIILEIITNLTGKKASNQLPINNNSNTSKDKLNKMQKLIHYLMSQGALLATVKPEFLLSQTDFTEIMKEKITKHLLGLDYYGAPEATTFKKKDIESFTTSQVFNSKLIERLNVVVSFYRSVSLESWTIVILQIVKLFMFGKLMDSDTFLQLPGVKDSLNEIHSILNENVYNEVNRSAAALNNSNVFSGAECLLLKWASIHYCKMNKGSIPVLTNFDQFKDPRIFLSIFKSHLPDQEINKDGGFSEVLRLLQSVQINLFNNEEQLVNANSIIYALLLQQMMKYLPHYLPSSKVVLKAPMNRITKYVMSVTNTSNFPLFYAASLNGSDTFSLKEKVFEIGPHKSHDVVVEYFPKMHYSEKTTLTLVPSHHNHQQQQETQQNLVEDDEKVEKKHFFLPKPPKSNKTAANQKEDPLRRSVRRNMKSAAKTTKNNSLNSFNFNAVPNISGASTVVVEITSQITYSAPYKTDYIEGKVYESTKFDVSISNIIKQRGHFQIYYRIYEMKEGEEEEDIKDLSAQMKSFMDNPGESITVDGSSDYENIISNYSAFIFNCREIEFKLDNEKEEVQLGVEFVPISLKSYRCLILFKNKDLGEITYQIIGRSKLPEIFGQPFQCKTESHQSCSLSIPVDFKNPSLFKAIAYTQTKLETFGIFVSERKFNDIVAQHAREVNSAYVRNLKPINFNVILSSDYYKSASEFLLALPSNLQALEDVEKDDKNVPTSPQKNKAKENFFNLSFHPTEAGEFPCRVVLQSQYDIRVYSIIGKSTHETTFISIDFDTVAFKEAKQVIPIQNNSELNWFYKCTFSGYSGFKGPTHFIAYSHSSYDFKLSFFPDEVGSFEGSISMYNSTKEYQTIYTLKGTAREPPASGKFTYQIKARESFTTSLPIPTFSRCSGFIKVTTTVPILTLRDDFIDVSKSANFIAQSPSMQSLQSAQTNASEQSDFMTNEKVDFDLYALRSGLSAGVITFTDEKTNAYSWYMIEITVDLPNPEETIYVTTATRVPIDINIPVVNNRGYPIAFDVEFEDEELTGESKITIPSDSDFIYKLHLNPLKASDRVTAVSFYHDTEGEYLYDINIHISPPEVIIMAPLSCVVGSTKSEVITLENPLNSQVVFKVENDNPKNFHVVTIGNSPIITIPPNGQMMIEVRFIPSSISVKSYATINFSSRIIGDFTYRFSGYGKPPIPASPTVVKSMIQVASSGQIKFLNPFPFSSKFEVVLQSESSFFSILSKRRNFTLYEYQEECQIIFSFFPKIENSNNANHESTILRAANQMPNEYRATILVSTVGVEPAIHWTFPIVGNIVQGMEKHVTLLKGKANMTAFHKIIVNLNNEKCNNDEISDTVSILSTFSSISNISGSRAMKSGHLRNGSRYRARNPNDYIISLDFPNEFIWMKKYFSILPLEIIDANYIPFTESQTTSNNNNNNNKVCVVLKVLLRKPVNACSLAVVVEKQSTNQKWRSEFDIHVDQDLTVNRIISLESPVNVATSTKIKVHESIRVQTEFSAYFTPNSSHDLSVAPAKAIIEPTMLDDIELPFVITYFPKTYGKMMKGVLIVESEELQLVFEVHGRMPKYVPPKTRKSGKIDTSTPEGAKPIRKSTRNFIKENIDCIRVYQKSGQRKLKMNNSYSDTSSVKSGSNNNANTNSKSNPRNRTKITKLSQNSV
ncbi:hypothetical protein M9Y10_013357 [Tritrichomonas musculus]|uniref:Calponin-homology (CH) domain-containing protein n=1 Tax=Tritrichomonas musculus TaxID=1915356 RepID=A0ABR2I7M1_9EUKA